MRTLSCNLLFLAFLCIACNTEGGDSYDPTLDTESVESILSGTPGQRKSPATPKAVDPSLNATHNRKLIKTGNLAWKTENLEDTRAQILTAVVAANAYISSDLATQTAYRNNHRYVIRVPADSFDTLVSMGTAGVKKFETRNINTRDVSAEYTDLKARLDSRIALEQRFYALLAKAKTIEEILQVEREIEQLRAEIDSMQGQFNLMQDQVALSTLTIEIYEEVEQPTVVVEEEGFLADLKDSLDNGWSVVKGGVLVIATLWPFILLGLTIFIGIKVYRRRKD